MSETLRERARKAAEARFPLSGEVLSVVMTHWKIDRSRYGEGYIAGANAERVIALEDAARVVCWQCGRGIAVARTDEQEWCHLYANDPGCVPCQASDIHTLIASAREAEAGKGEK